MILPAHELPTAPFVPSFTIQRCLFASTSSHS
jgi:hypothetical protein